ncbi:MAG: efflux RND transporter permease subunit [Gammaproteobacteria bacterium]|nr:efflux RND transporter permease subunit [Gammaproteobacteria bacterium]NNF61317.1 efflux RND transporter permease subunit [Gammaproteobacteria bacterium]NNM20103.1 efflux RND transporter permease subunit [Gammaproteobacteria bacterium]
MSLTLNSIRNPAGIGVVVAIILFFGLFSLSKLPIQLFPNIDEPQISINTGWRAASPREVESEIVEPLEEVLQGLPGLKELNAGANKGDAWINLTFGLGTDMQKTLIDVISRLNRLQPLPRDANPPQVNLGGGRGGGGANETLTWFFVQLLPGTAGPVEEYQRTIEEILKPRLETIPGVAGVIVHAGQQQQLQIVFDPYRAAELAIPIPQVAAVAGRANDVSGGFVDVGRRQYTLRFAGRYSPEQLSELILDWRDGRPVRLGDIADIALSRGDRTGFTVQNGNPAMGVEIFRESGANALQTLNEVKKVVAQVREEQLQPMGLSIHQSFDASVFIYRAISLVTSNLGIGILLAIGVLWWFLRQGRATLLVATAIPISLLSTFVVLYLTGRTLNVISLAGLAFAVGMVLDAAIVVLENIVRLREAGRSADDAAAEGTSQVWGALLASTATTVAIFLPVIFLKDVEGQLFADLALTIAIAVSISLLVAVTVLPTAAAKWLRNEPIPDRHAAMWSRMSDAITRLTDVPARRYLTIAVLMGVPILTTVMLMPKLDYLPPVKRDAIDGFFRFPPGANAEVIENEIFRKMVDRLEPYMSGREEPALKNYYIIFWGNGGTIGARVKDQSRVKELEKIIREEVTAGLPDTSAFVMQGNLFGGFGGGRNISLQMQSSDTAALMSAAREGMDILAEVMPEAQVQPWPGTEMAEPELRLIPNDDRINEAGWTRETMSNVVRALGDGIWIGEHFDGEKRMDIILRAEKWSNPEELEAVPLMTANGVIPLGQMVRIERTVGPNQIFRIDRRRTVALNVTPPEGMSLEEGIAILRADVEPKLREMLPADGGIRYGGSADALKNAVSNMVENFGLAIIVLFLLMSALFRSIRDSIMVLMALPLATVGGVIAIRLLNLISFQPMDLLTMIGFIILMGLVVNNAILLVHQTRSAEREGLHRREAINQALRVRMRPIFMSTLTSIFGMLPLVLVAGAGSVIYRGLAAVIVGGMLVSTVFTLLLLPTLLRVGERKPDPVLASGLATAATPQTRVIE